MNSILVAVSSGEILDKITILKIKNERITDPEKLKNIQFELETLSATVSENNLLDSPEIQKLFDELLAINLKLWEIEDDIRDKERAKEFDELFIELARSVYFTNDIRADLKKKINLASGSAMVEEKSYSDYQ